MAELFFEDCAACVLEAVVNKAVMALADRRILTFDVVGTLIDFEAGILGCLRGIVERAGKDVPDPTLLAAFARAEDAQQHVSPAMPFTQMLNPIYERLAGELGLPRGNGDADRLAASIPQWPAFTDATDGLAALGARYRLVALTNADNWALEHMSRTLGDPFDDRVTAEDVGANKPDPQVFAYCRGRQSVHGYALGDFLHVAQSQYHDIGAAKRLGFEVCWIERRRGRHGTGATPPPAAVTTPDHHFSSIAELVTAVETLG
jgi:putative hydrolase of the HAD superfamily